MKTRDPQRIAHLLDLFQAEWRLHPDLRFGQLVVNTFTTVLGRPPSASDIFNLEDDRVIDHFSPPEVEDGADD